MRTAAMKGSYAFVCECRLFGVLLCRQTAERLRWSVSEWYWSRLLRSTTATETGAPGTNEAANMPLTGRRVFQLPKKMQGSMLAGDTVVSGGYGE
jgi:hypothetical protein